MSSVLDAAMRRIYRTYKVEPPPRRRPVLQPVAPDPPAPPPEARQPVLTLEPPRKDRLAGADPRALATLLADDLASKIDQLCYVWNVIQELEPFERPGEPSLRRRAAELFLAAAGGNADVPIEGPLRAVKSFLASHGMEEEYIEHLCRWYIDGGRR